MPIAFKLFIMGLTLGLTSCLLLCAPILVPYIGASQNGWKKGLKATLVFSLSRLLSYTLQGLVAGISGTILFSFIYSGTSARAIWITGGALVAFLGILIIFGQDPRLRLCHTLRGRISDDSTKSMLVLGLIIAFSPCLPLLGALTYIALQARSWLEGMLYGFYFGIGTTISPLLPLGILAGAIPKKVFKNPLFYEIFKRICGFLLFILGTQLILSKLLWR